MTLKEFIDRLESGKIKTTEQFGELWHECFKVVLDSGHEQAKSDIRILTAIRAGWFAGAMAQMEATHKREVEKYENLRRN